MSLREQLVTVYAINFFALGLDVGPYRPACVRPFVPVQSRDRQTVINDVEGVIDKTGLVGIFDSKEKLAVILSATKNAYKAVRRLPMCK